MPTPPRLLVVVRMAAAAAEKTEKEVEMRIAKAHPMRNRWLATRRMSWLPSRVLPRYLKNNRKQMLTQLTIR